MNRLSLEEKKQHILEYEESMAHRLARRVLEKPAPPIWMILMPIFFVFHAQKIKEYAKGLKDFTEHYLVSRRRALDTAYTAIKNGAVPEIESLMKYAETIPVEARPLYRDWISLLIDHYCNLLAAPGNSVQEMTRAHYKNKSSYLIFNNQLNSKETIFNAALLPKIEGDQQDILFIAERLQRGAEDIRRKESEKTFS